MAKKQINVRVDEEVYAGIEERAAAAGLDVTEYARQVLADESNDLRHRFLAAADHVATEWGPYFGERFGHPGSRKDEARRDAAA